MLGRTTGLVLAGLSVWLLGGCGYRLVGTLANNDDRSIRVAVASDALEPGLALAASRAIAAQLDGRQIDWSRVDEPNAASLVVRVSDGGSQVSAARVTESGDDSRVSATRWTATVGLDVAWYGGPTVEHVAFVGRAGYEDLGVGLWTEARRADALDDAADDAARQLAAWLVARLVSDSESTTDATDAPDDPP